MGVIVSPDIASRILGESPQVRPSEVGQVRPSGGQGTVVPDGVAAASASKVGSLGVGSSDGVSGGVG